MAGLDEGEEEEERAEAKWRGIGNKKKRRQRCLPVWNRVKKKKKNGAALYLRFFFGNQTKRR